MKPSITLASWHVEAMGRISFSTEVGGGCTLGMGHTDARLSIDGRNPSHKEALYKSATTGASSMANNFQIGHFRITFGLFFKASLGAHPFI